MVDWNKEIDISWKMEIVIMSGLLLLAIAIHYGLSFVLFSFESANSEWTQMNIFYFLTFMTLMVWMPMTILVVLQNINESKEQEDKLERHGLKEKKEDD